MKLIRGFGLISNSDVKLYASFAMLANWREEIVFTGLLQTNKGVAGGVAFENILGRAIVVIVLIYPNHSVQPWMVLEHCISFFTLVLGFTWSRYIYIIKTVKKGNIRSSSPTTKVLLLAQSSKKPCSLGMFQPNLSPTTWEVLQLTDTNSIDPMVTNIIKLSCIFTLVFFSFPSLFQFLLPLLPNLNLMLCCQFSLWSSLFLTESNYWINTNDSFFLLFKLWYSYCVPIEGMGVLSVLPQTQNNHYIMRPHISVPFFSPHFSYLEIASNFYYFKFSK